MKEVSPFKESGLPVTLGWIYTFMSHQMLIGIPWSNPLPCPSSCLTGRKEPLVCLKVNFKVSFLCVPMAEVYSSRPFYFIVRHLELFA